MVKEQQLQPLQAGRRYLDKAEFAKVDAYWRAANYLSVGQIYLMDNPLLRKPLLPEHIKPRLLGHWGTTPGLNFILTHLNRVIRLRNLDMISILGPGHGGPAAIATSWLDGTYSKTYNQVSRDVQGMRLLFRQFSFPGGVSSHISPGVPGSIHEGGELGYSLSHAYGAAFDNPHLIVVCVIGDGEAETGPLAASWQSNVFLNPVHDGAVLPILHLNGYKIANPTILARIGQKQLHSFLCGNGYKPHWVTGDDPYVIHHEMAMALDAALDEIARIQHSARQGNPLDNRPQWPIIVLRTPKGWTGPKKVNGVVIADSWRSHQIPLSGVRTNTQMLTELESWLRSYQPQELFNDNGIPVHFINSNIPPASKQLGVSSYANGGLRLTDLNLPKLNNYAVPVAKPGDSLSEATRVLGSWLADVIRNNPKIFRLFGPDETLSNRLDAVFTATNRVWLAQRRSTDEYLAPAGQVMEVLSEHLCQGWLEGYLLTGRHGLFACYEAFIHIVDSMFNQHAKWLKISRTLSWRQPIASLNYLLTSHVWRQDHNGFSHQDPGFIDHVVNKKPEIVRIYLPPDANTLLTTTDHCLRSRNYVNVIIAGKQLGPNWFSLEQAKIHCARGLGVLSWASNDQHRVPDVILACAGDVPTLETLAATQLIRERMPELAIRVINIVDLMRLLPHNEHPHGLTDPEFDAYFAVNTPVICAFHGYPWLVHRLTYRRACHSNLHVRGYKEEGTTTTPFDMVMLNDLDRFHLVIDVIDRVPGLAQRAADIRQEMVDMRMKCRMHTRAYGEDPSYIRNWKWKLPAAFENQDRS